MASESVLKLRSEHTFVLVIWVVEFSGAEPDLSLPISLLSLCPSLKPIMPFTKHVLSPTGTGKFILSFGCCFLYRMYTDNSDIQVAFHNFLLLLSVTCRDSMSASSTRTICSSQSSYRSLNLFVPCQISEGCRTVAGWQNCYTHLSSQLTDEIASEVRQSFLKSPSELINSFWWTSVVHSIFCSI